MKQLYLNQSNQFDAQRLKPLFNWGQGVFTSFRLQEGKVLFQKMHEERLKKHFENLFNINCSFDLKAEFEFIKEKKDSGKGRLCLFLEENGECSSLLEISSFVKKDELKVKAIQDNRLLSYEMKLPFYALNFQKLQEVKEEKFDDYLNLDEKNNVIELSTSNLFVLKDDKTALFPMHERAFVGIMQKELISFLKTKSFKVELRRVEYSELKEALALFATNSVQCMSFIRMLDSVEFKKNSAVIEWEKMINIFCEKNYGKE